MDLFFRALILFVGLYGLFDTGSCFCSTSTTVPSASTSTINYIESPNYPSYYPRDQSCTWTASASGGDHIIWAIKVLSVERGYDSVKVFYSSTNVYHSDNSNHRRFGVSASSQITVSFYSDISVQYGGFSLAYLAVSSSDFASCGSTIASSTTAQTLAYSYTEQAQSPCTITISASAGNNVQFKVPFLYGTLTWIDGSTYNFVTTESYTATYVSTGDSVQIRCSSYTTYLLEYEEVVNTVTAVPLPAAQPGAEDICDTSSILIAESYDQYITSPNYPSPYESWLSCNVIIECASSDDSVYLEIVDIDLSSYDTLYIWDGPSSSYSREWTTLATGVNLTSTGNSFTLRFFTDGVTNLRGVNVLYRNETRSIPSCASSYSSTAITTSPTTLTSPGFPSNYANNYDEYWLLVKPLQTDNIVLQLTSLKIEDQYQCNYDYISIYDGPCENYALLAKLCGENEETIQDSTGQYILVHFHTDISITYSGFSMNVYIGSQVLATAGQATDEEERESGDFPDWIYGPLVTGIVILIAIMACCYVSCLNKQRKAKVDASGKPIYQKPKKLTTHEMLNQFENNKTSAEQEKLNKTKIKRKPPAKSLGHPEPNPPGPDTNIVNKSEIGGHPAPDTTDDAAYPPILYSFGDQSHQQRAPTFVSMGGGGGGSGTTSPITPVQTDDVPTQINDEPTPISEAPIGKVPDPFPYLTPAEAREKGVYGQSH